MTQLFISHSFYLCLLFIFFSLYYQNSSEAVHVNFTLNLKKLLDLNAKNQALTSLIEMTIIWTDDYLTWDLDLFNQLKRVQFNIGDIWTPSIRIFQL